MFEIIDVGGEEMYSTFVQQANAVILELESRNLNATALAMRLLMADYEANLSIARHMPLKEAQQTVST
ncbi:MAG: hypothetical protein ABJH07_26115 [Sedimentitalea sp.]|uniref:hypothetical protein n=1 Tax=Sedimentitalea sp. TaxID=2048915 RepID=UPI00329A3DFF